MKPSGFSLIELLIATSVVMVGVVSLARLFVISSDASRQAFSSSNSLLLAAQKLEALQADVAGLSPSPADALTRDVPGYVDYLDSGGALLASTPPALPAGTIFIRRWSVEPLPGSTRDEVILRVNVVPWNSPGRSGLARDVGAGTHLAIVKARRTPWKP